MSGGGDGIYDDSKFTEFRGGSHIPSTDPDNEWSFTSWVLDFPPFTEITNESMNPNNFRGVQHFAIMRWVSDKQGVANVNGQFKKNASLPSDGTIGHVFRNGEELFAEKTLEAAAPFELMVDDLKVGDTFDFAVDYGAEFGGTSSNDVTFYTIMVDLISEGLLGDFDLSGVLDAPDIDDLTQQSAGGTNPAGYDLTGDTLVNSEDVTEWIRSSDIFYSWLGDSDLDGEFKSDDVIQVLSENTYENDIDAVWTSGDWNGSGRFDSQDVIDALADGGYESGPRTDVAAVPEPSALTLLVLGCLPLLRRRRGA
jgi:hypothetical protein